MKTHNPFFKTAYLSVNSFDKAFKSEIKNKVSVSIRKRRKIEQWCKSVRFSSEVGTIFGCFSMIPPAMKTLLEATTAQAHVDISSIQRSAE